MAGLEERGNVLVVDDNEMNCEMLQLRLEHRGYSVVSVLDGYRALDLISNTDFDVVILDIMMPEISGVDVLRQIRAQHSMTDLPVIMATAKDQSEDVVQALELGANDYVTKPIDFSVLCARIRTQLALRDLSMQKDQFIQVASHDLKNPLSVVRGYARVLQMLFKDGVEIQVGNAREIASKIERQTLTMERIISDFLDFDAMQNGELKLNLEAHCLAGICTRVVDQLHGYSRSKNIEVRFEALSKSLCTSMDETRIQQVVLNLLDNAIKFSQPGSAVIVRAMQRDAEIVCEIEDSGPGIAPDDMDKLFVKYARLKNRPTGGEKSSGLGLAITKDLVQLHSGQIGARNNPGKGATFWFSLPVVEIQTGGGT